MAQKKIRLALCDDMEAFCRCLKRSFEKEPDIEVVGIAGSAAKCLELVRAEKPDVLLLDMQMEMYDSGAEIIPSLKEVSPDTKIIMLTIHHEDDLRRFLRLCARSITTPPRPRSVRTSLRQ